MSADQHDDESIVVRAVAWAVMILLGPVILGMGLHEATDPNKSFNWRAFVAGTIGMVLYLHAYGVVFNV